MFPALSLGLLLHGTQTLTLELSRGSTVGDHRYWAVSDTYLDMTEADRPQGGFSTLLGGRGRTILIRFGDLERSLPWMARISKATLYLSPSSPEKPQISGVSAISAPWGEGPMFFSPLGRPVDLAPVRGAATWKQRRNGDGGVSWMQPGASGPQDAVVIPGAKMEIEEKEIAITGLAPALQKMRDRWYDNYGFALTFAGSCEFFSSQAKIGKPRLVVEWTLDSAIAGPDLAVQWIDRTPENPRDGEEVTYRAAVKNIGATPTKAFSGQWTIGERTGAKFEVAKALAPDEQTIVETKKTYRQNLLDHRTQPIVFRTEQSEPDTDANNDALAIDEDALPIALTGKPAGQAQQTLRILNDVYFAQSRFSFAPDGVRERVRLVPDAANAAVIVELKDGQSEEAIIGEIVTKLTGLNAVEASPSVTYENRQIPFGDLYSGLNGFGDTRFDGLIPPGIPMLYAPVASPLFDTLTIEPTSLLCSTEVAALNTALGKRGKAREGALWDLPSTVILRAVDMTGKPLDGAELSFFQIDNGKMPDSPTQTILTKEGGTVILENRDAKDDGDKDASHHLKRNPFGQLRADGSNGTILIRALINGEVEWGWLKAWQLADSFHRGNLAAAIIDVRFNAPGGLLDRTTNLAKGRLVTDLAGSLPAKLIALTDEDAATEVKIGDKKGDWVEIDLGRDRPIGEVRLLFKNPQMPTKFDIQCYATGQQAPETEAWVKDLDFTWTRINHGIADKNGVLGVPYRGPVARARYIRIVNRSGGPGTIGDVQVVPLKAE